MNENIIYKRFADVVSKKPGRPAVYQEDRTFTFSQLNELIKSVAAAFPVKSERIGIITDHGAGMIASMLAVLKAGSAYVPAEPDFPTERIRFMMKESGVGFIISQRKYADKLAGFPLLFLENIEDHIEETVSADASCEARPESPAYILYTSGSTGVPKGVVVTNRNVTGYARAFDNEYHLKADDIMLQYSVCSFDIFVEEVFASLLSGAAVAVPPESAKTDVNLLMDFVREKGVTIISGFPYLLMDLNALDAIPESLRLLISGGDVLRAGYVDRLLPQVEVYNTYGPSETTVCATYFHCNGQQALTDGTYPVGKPILDVDVQILDENLNPVLQGQIGELCISGGGVSDGYLDKSKNEMFVTRSDGTIMYRSGDLGRMLPDGNLAFLHRKDSQVMILGKRVEPEEVENVLCRCPGVKTGLVYPSPDSSGLSHLTAYIVPEEGAFSLESVRNRMEAYLTPYMMPERFVLLDSIPLTDNCKPDIKELLENGGSADAGGTENTGEV